MIRSILQVAALSAGCVLQAAAPDISNLSNCIQDVRSAAAHAPKVLTFDPYMDDYQQLITDLTAATPRLPHVYQQVAAKPLIKFLKSLGENQFLQIFSGDATDEQTATLQQIIPDAALAVLSWWKNPPEGIDAFEEIVSDLYQGFLSEEARAGKQTGVPINPPTYGVIPPLVKFGSADAGPYTWPGDATSQILGMGCGIVNLPPAQMKGGLIAWSSLGHETGGHDMTHADQGLLDELAAKVHSALLQRFRSQGLADYWARCIDETAADICGYLNVGPSLGVSLIGYFRALGDGKLRSAGSSDDPHPIDLLRGYLGAAVVKRLGFKDALLWSQTILAETHKDVAPLYLVNADGTTTAFPVSFSNAVASTEIVAEVIMHSKLNTLQQHSLQEIQDWTDQDQGIVDSLVPILKAGGQLPANLTGPGFYASYIVAAATQTALEGGSNIPGIFNKMIHFLAQMNAGNPTWSNAPTSASKALIEKGLKGAGQRTSKGAPHIVRPKQPELAPR